MAKKSASGRSEDFPRNRTAKIRRSKGSRARTASKPKRASAGHSGKHKLHSKSAKNVRLQTGLRLLRTEKSIAAAARKSGLSASKLRSFAIKKKLLIRRGKKWVVQKDVPRKLLIFSEGEEHVIQVGAFKTASRIGKYMAGVRWFVQTNDLHHLEPFAGKFVKDVSGKRFPLETRPNVLHRLANSVGATFEQVYRIVV